MDDRSHLCIVALEVLCLFIELDVCNTLLEVQCVSHLVEQECQEEVLQIYKDVIREEKEWADYLFMKGPVIGLNANILKDFVDYTAVGALKEIGIKYQTPAPKTTPIPWFNKHVNTSNKQTALQENESTNYVIGVMSDNLDYDQLPNL